MNLNDRRLGAYNKILKPESSVTQEDSAKEKEDTKKRPRQAESQQTNSKKSDTWQTDPRKSDFSLPGLIKVPDSTTGGKDSPFRKVAKFLLIIGVDEAAKVLSRLSPEQTEKVVLELASIRRVDPDEASLVLAEFESLLQQARQPSGGVETARSILEAAFGSERAQQMLEKAVPHLHGKPFDYLEGVDPERLHRIIADELPSMKALVLSQLKPILAAGVLNIMPQKDKTEVVIRLARLKNINPDVLRRVDDAIREKFQTINTAHSDAVDGRSALAEILKRMSGSSEKAILEGLADVDPDLGKDMRERLFTLDDIVGCDDRFMQETLRSMSEHDLAILLAGKPEPFRTKIFTNCSKTRGTLILEEEKVISPVSRIESERVTGTFFSIMRRAWEDGKFTISGRDTKEEWIT